MQLRKGKIVALYLQSGLGEDGEKNIDQLSLYPDSG